MSDLQWHKSTLSADGDGCVEVAQDPEGCVWVRNSKDPDGPRVRYTKHEWAAFVGGVKLGEFEA